MKSLIKISNEHPILLFDGVCNLCNGFVQFVIERDPEAQFKFAALQSEEGQELLQHFGLPQKELFSVILIENEKAYTRSTAALRMTMLLKSPWKIGYAFIILPKFIRDFFYKKIALNRYKWFGEKDSCMIPTPELKSRFLNQKMA